MGRVPLDLTGQRFGKLVAVELTGERRQRSPEWLCRCDCGGEILVISNSLRSGETKSCGCLQRSTAELTGTRVSRLLVVRDAGIGGLGGGRYWLCKCDCGNEKNVQASRLLKAVREGKGISCGCLHEESKKRYQARGQKTKNVKFGWPWPKSSRRRES